MPTVVLLEDAIDNILDAIVDVLVTAAGSSGDPLETVQAVVRGDRSRPMPKLPSLWVVPEPAVSDTVTHGLKESWTMPVRIAALVSGDDPDVAGREAVRLAARSRTTVLQQGGRRLGLAFVQDTTSREFEPHARTSERNRNLYWADATVAVRFTVWENV